MNSGFLRSVRSHKTEGQELQKKQEVLESNNSTYGLQGPNYSCAYMSDAMVISFNYFLIMSA